MFSLAEYLMKPVVPMELRTHSNAYQVEDVSKLSEQKLKQRLKKREYDRAYRAKLRAQDREYLAQKARTK